MNVVPRSVRPRRRRITTDPLDPVPTAGSAASKTGAAAKKEAPVRLKHDYAAGRRDPDRLLLPWHPDETSRRPPAYRGRDVRLR